MENLAVLNGDWKYHTKELFKVKATKRETKGPTLNNLKNDIGESVNLTKEHPEIAERLTMALEKFNSEQAALKTKK